MAFPRFSVSVLSRPFWGREYFEDKLVGKTDLCLLYIIQAIFAQ